MMMKQLAILRPVGLLFLLLGVFQTGRSQRPPAPETDRGIRLPPTDGHYQQTANYIEEVPDADYRHASEAAHEAFRDMKFGVRIVWGLYSMQAMNQESWNFLKMSNADKQAYLESIRSFNPTDFSAEGWMSLFKRAGAKCFAFVTKHHDGFSLYDTRARVHERVNYLAPGGPAIEKCDVAYSVMESPFRRDVVKELVAAARKEDIKVNLYYSHPDWYDADFRPYALHPLQTDHIKNHPLEYARNDIFKANVNKIMTPEPTAEQKARMIARHRTQLRELLTNYGPVQMLCLDQYLGKPVWPEIKATLKELRQLQPDVMFRARGIGNYGDYYTPEGFVPGDKENTNMPWMVIYPLASSFSYDKDSSRYKGAQWIIENLVDAVSKGGNFMVGIGPDGSGKFHPKAVEQLEATGRWLAVNGEGIYNTRSGGVWKEGRHIRYTVSKDHRYVYAYTLLWPGEQLRLRSVEPEKGSRIYLLGHPSPLAWTYAGGELIVQVPQGMKKKGGPAWGFRITGRLQEAPADVVHTAH